GALIAMPDHPVRPPRPPMKLPSTRVLIAAGAVLGVVVIGLVARCASGGGDTTHAAAPPSSRTASPPGSTPSAPSVPAPARDFGSTHTDERAYRDVSAISVALGRVQLAQHRTADGLASLRAAVQTAPALRTDPTLIASVVALLPDPQASDF